MAEPELKSGTEWLREFSRERRAARARTLVVRVDSTYEFKPKIKHNWGNDKELIDALKTRKGELTQRIIKRLKELNPSLKGVDLGDKVKPKRTNFGSQSNILYKGVEWQYPPSLHRRIAKQAGCCYLCSEPFGPGMRGATYDHVTPRILGGKDYNNILLAHLKCNGRKDDRPPYACELLYLEFVRKDLAGDQGVW